MVFGAKLILIQSRPGWLWEITVSDIWFNLSILRFYFTWGPLEMKIQSRSTYRPKRHMFLFFSLAVLYFRLFKSHGLVNINGETARCSELNERKQYGYYCKRFHPDYIPRERLFSWKNKENDNLFYIFFFRIVEIHALTHYRVFGHHTWVVGPDYAFPLNRVNVICLWNSYIFITIWFKTNYEPRILLCSTRFLKSALKFHTIGPNSLWFAFYIALIKTAPTPI